LYFLSKKNFKYKIHLNNNFIATITGNCEKTNLINFITVQLINIKIFNCSKLNDSSRYTLLRVLVLWKAAIPLSQSRKANP